MAPLSYVCLLQKTGSSVADGRTAPSCGRNCLTSKSPILSIWLSLQSKWVLLWNHVLCPKEEGLNLFTGKMVLCQYDLPLLKLVDDTLAIDRCTGSTLKADAIAKEMLN
ncbi:hypothetical protein ACHAXS_001446, partial [Conticribra weissflogii]